MHVVYCNNQYKNKQVVQHYPSYYIVYCEQTMSYVYTVYFLITAPEKIII